MFQGKKEKRARFLSGPALLHDFTYFFVPLTLMVPSE